MLEEYDQFDDYLEMVVQFGVSKQALRVNAVEDVYMELIIQQ